MAILVANYETGMLASNNTISCHFYLIPLTGEFPGLSHNKLAIHYLVGIPPSRPSHCPQFVL